MPRMQFRPSPATVVATIALFVALAGTSVAAVKIFIPPKSIGTAKLANHAVTHAKLANNAVTSINVLNHSLLGVDFAPGQIPPGPPGAQGARGPTGLAGPPAASLWAVVNPIGSLARGSGVLTVTHPAGGIYRVQFNRPITACAWLATIGSATSVTSFGFVETELASGTTDTLHVGTRAADGSVADRGFHLAVFC